MNLTQTSLRRPITTLMVFLCFVVIGVISTRLVPLEFMPEIDEPDINISIPYPGATPEEVERQITRPAEEVLATISGIKRMVSNSGENGANIEMVFDWGEDTDIKALEAKEKLDGIRNQLPADVRRIYVRQQSSSDWQLLTLRISSNRDLSNAYDMLDRNLKRRIERIDGVSKVDLYGVDKKEIRIQLRVDRIAAHHVDLERLLEILRRSNFSVTAGRITDARRRFVVRPMGQVTSIEALGALVVGDNNLRLRDIARITYSHPERDYGRHLDRRYAIGLDVFKESGANSVDVARRVMAEIDKISRTPEMQGISLFVMENQAEGIVSSLDELLNSGLLGGALAILVLYFFLRRIVTTLIVALAVPFSLLVTMAFLFFLGMSLNILTMMGLMLAIGMLVDNAVVVTESIYRHHQLEADKAKATLTGVREVALAVTAGTLTTAIVFLPAIVSPKDEISIYMKHVSTTIIIALGASLLIAQTVVPLLASKIRFGAAREKPTLIDGLIERYSSLLKWTLEHRRATVAIIVLILASVAVPISFVKTDMFPRQERRRLRLFYHLDKAYSLEKVEAAVDVIEEYLFAHKDEFEIKSVYSYYQTDFASSTILLTDEDQAKKSVAEIRDAIRARLPKIAIARPSFDWRTPGAGSEGVRLTLVGQSSEQLVDVSRRVAWALGRLAGFKDVRSEAEVGHQEVHVVVNRERARQFGFNTAEIANTIAAAMRGQDLPAFRSAGGEIDMRVAFRDKDKQTLEQLRDLPLMMDGSRQIKLASLADFRVRRGPQRIHHEDRKTVIGVTANLDGLTRGEAKEKIRRLMKQFDLPQGVSWSFGRSFQREDETGKIMMVNTLLALALIYLVMAALFESLIFPAAIWSSILFAIIGVWWFFMFTGTIFSLMAWIGVLILIGVVVNNGIVLVDHITHLRGLGMSRTDAILRAGRDRLRPILMTAGTTVLSLVPLSMATTQIGGDGPPYFPMARAIVGGLTFATAVTLVVLPTIYVLLDDLRNWAKRVVQLARA